jgi:hypothetical protein
MLRGMQRDREGLTRVHKMCTQPDLGGGTVMVSLRRAVALQEGVPGADGGHRVASTAEKQHGPARAT